MLFRSGPSVYAITVKLHLPEILSASHSSKQHNQTSISHLDHCNTLFSNLDKYSHDLLISIHNSAAKIIFSGQRFDQVISLSLSPCLAPCYVIISNISISSLPWTRIVYTHVCAISQSIALTSDKSMMLASFSSLLGILP